MSVAAAPSVDRVNAGILATVKQYWGYDTLRPLQEQAIRAGIEHRDSLVVMPTGGGKSLCYQVPAALANRTDVVVSPLISLMKDQVDGLREAGYPAAALHSGLTEDQRREVERGIAQRQYRLIFASPERLLTPGFLNTIGRLYVRAFHIDEAHCISQWGHDFRPEYRQLATLKERFPQASVHAYTATATPRVRQDIIDQLRLADPNVLVGVFDRPNLVYRLVPRSDLFGQVIDVIRRHAGEAVIVYCVSRRDTEDMAATLVANGIKAAAYHAGMDKDQRTKTQEEFAEERLDVVVATVAFGMGIDRSNVRCVVHAAMPKTVEHYQQESGRAGRDGLEAECIMFYSLGDVPRWHSLIEFSAEKIEDPELRFQTIQAGKELLEHVASMCNSLECRHRALSRYFGQAYPLPNCGACDVCLGEVQGMPGATVIAQKILSCVARVQQRFGVGHVVDVLIGSNTEMVRRCNHQSLSTYGLLKEFDKKTVQALVFQLVDQGLLTRTSGDKPILQLSEESITVLKNQREVQLIDPRTGTVKRSTIEESSWEHVDRGLFEHLREVRRMLAIERGVAAFVVFSDNTLRELASVRPSTLDNLRRIKGIGESKLREHGRLLIETLNAYCLRHNLSMDQQAKPWPGEPIVRTKGPRVVKVSAAKEQAFSMFDKRESLDAVTAATGRARSTVSGYLEEWIRDRKPASIDAWVAPAEYQRIRAAAAGLEGRSMKPVFDALNGEVPYEHIRAVVAHVEATD